MASRTVSIILRAQVDNYLANVKAAEDATRQLDARTKTMTETLRAQQQQLVKHHEALAKVGVGMVAFGAVAAAGLALAVKASTEFGAKMAQLQSLSHANAATMKQLSDAAMTVGTAYGFSATQVADAQIELQKAGVSVQEQLGGALTGALTLAAAGQIDVAQATEITTVAMTQFRLSAASVPHLADLLAAGADKALGSVGDLGEALKNGGLQAANMGLTIDDTVGTLSAFANAGILGAEAGTQLRSMFLRLQNPTKESKAVLDEYGIAINDAGGKFVGISKFADELHDKLYKLSDAQRNQALATVFGSHAIVGATVLYQDGGAAADKAGKSIGDWIRNVNDSGFAAAQAAGKMDSLQGDVQKLAAAFQTDLIKAGSGANDALRGITKTATGLLGVLGDVPGPVQSIVVAGAALTAGIGLLGGGFLIAVPKVAAFKLALKELKVEGASAAGTFGKISGALVGITSLMSGVAAAGQMGAANTGQINDAADSLQKRLSNINALFKGNALVGAGIRNAFDQEMSGEAADNKGLDGMLLNITKVGDVYRNHEGAFAALGSQLAGMAQIDYSKAAHGFDDIARKVGALGNTDKLNHLVTLLGPDFVSHLQGVAKGIGVTASQANLLAIASGKGSIGQRALTYETEQAAKATQDQSTQLAQLAGQASAATTDIDALQKTIEGFGSAQLDARGATRAMYQAIDDATAAVVKNGHTLDVHTQKGRDNQAALDGIATAADAAASKVLKQTGSVSKAAGVMQTGRDAFVKLATQITGSGKAAEKLADQIGLIPGNITIAVKGTDLDPALIKIKRIKDAMNALDGTAADVYVGVVAAGGDPGRAGQIVRNITRAGGGQIDGSGPKGIDSVPAILAPGEHVLTARDVDRLGGQAGVYAFRASLDDGSIGRYADGGAIAVKNRAGNAAAKALARAHAALRAANKRKAGKGKDAAVQRAEAAITAATTKRDAAWSAATQLRHDRQDFVSAERRTPGRNVNDPLAYVDQLRAMSRDTADYSPARRQYLNVVSASAEAALTKLTRASAAATEKLDGLKQSSAQLHDSIAQAISGGYQASAVPLTGVRDASTRTVASGWVTRNGIRMQNYQTVDVAASAGHLTAGGIAAYYTHGASDAKRFAEDLATLAKRGLNPQLLAEVAGYGVAQGAPIVAALLSASKSQIAEVNKGYAGIGSAAGAAGKTVADDNYAKQIAAVQNSADKITAQIASDGEKLRKVIAKAFGLKGYATGTASAEAGIRWVGEDGPELVGFRGGEAVLNRADSRRWVRGVSGSGYAGQQPVEVHIAPFPDTITVQDASGFTAPMRVIAHQVVSQRNDQIAVRVMSGA